VRQGVGLNTVRDMRPTRDRSSESHEDAH
jgi:hypothetical protein